MLSEFGVILFGLRFDVVVFGGFFMELFWICSGPFGIVSSGSIWRFSSLFDTLVAVSEQ